MTDRIRVGLLGCGVVGKGVLSVLRDHTESISARLGKPIEVGRVFLREGSPSRAEVNEDMLVSDPAQVINDPGTDIVAELMGGIEPALTLVKAALQAGKPVITANKALMASHGPELVSVAREHGVDLYYEAAVAGGVPIIRTLRESLASDRILSLRGILNGTSNYILSRMSAEGTDFGVALEAAQAAGYAEADPTLDVGGGDAAHKLALLAGLAFGTAVDPDSILTEGITDVAATDIRCAARFGYVFKPLAVGRLLEGGELDLRVHPALVPRRDLLAHVHDALNTVHIEGAAVGATSLTGPGAGALPTAVSVVSDLLDVARNLISKAAGRVPPRAFQEHLLADLPVRSTDEHVCPFYMRLTVVDQPGVLADLTHLLGEHGVSISQMVQEAGGGKPAGDTEPDDLEVDVVLLTHASREGNVTAALTEIDKLAIMKRPTRRFRIEKSA